MKKGDIVKFKNPLPDEIGLIMRVLEVNGNRVLVEELVEMVINPTKILDFDELMEVYTV